MRTSRQGQITLLVLLLGVLGLTVGLSGVSRSLQDAKQATQVNSGTRALAMAEAAVENRIAETTDTSLITTRCGGNSNLSLTNEITANLPSFVRRLQTGACITSNPDSELTNVSPVDAIAIDLTKMSTVTNGNVKKIAILWDDRNIGDPAQSPYLAVTKLKQNDVLEKYAVYPKWMDSSFLQNGAIYKRNFASGITSFDCEYVKDYVTGNHGKCLSSSYKQYQTCFKVPVSATDKLLRVRVLNASSAVGLCAFDSNGTSDSYVAGDFPTFHFYGKAELTDGTLKTVSRVLTAGGGISGLFDYAIFSAGDLTP